jgi:hypothetical protein
MFQCACWCNLDEHTVEKTHGGTIKNPTKQGVHLNKSEVNQKKVHTVDGSVLRKSQL